MCKNAMKMGGYYVVICKDKDGNVKWKVEEKNLIVDAWLNEALDLIFNQGAQPANFYMSLVVGPAPTFDGSDTALSHIGWSEFLNYDEATRPEWAPDAAVIQEVENPTDLVFTINGAVASVAGLFIISLNSTKNNFLTGSLVSEVVFAQGAKNVAAGDTLEVSYKQGATSA